MDGETYKPVRVFAEEGTQMIDLDNLKLVLYDFDDTLCIHKVI